MSTRLREHDRGAAVLTTIGAALRRSSVSAVSVPLEVARRADVCGTALWLFVASCTAYYVGNFVLRWQQYAIFSGHGAYGWSEPSVWQRAGIVIATVAGPLLIFSFGATVLRVVFAQTTWFAVVLLAALLLVFSELDATWYNMSGEHVRWVDIELFKGLDVRAHLGIDASTMTHVVAACGAHVIVVVLLGAALAGIARRRPTALLQAWMRPTLLSGFVGILVWGNWASLRLSPEQSWRAISRANRLNATTNALFRQSEPEAEVLAEKYAELSVVGPGRKQDKTHSAAAPGARVLIIEIEGWHPDFVNDTLMPKTAEFRRSARRFARHQSTGNNTLLGTLGILFGQSPAFYFGHEGNGQRSIFLDELGRLGYRTKLFGDGLTSYRFIDSYLRNFSENGDFRGVGDSILRDISTFVRSGQRTFSFYYYVNTHFPYHHDSTFRAFLPEVPDDYQFDPGDMRHRRAEIVNRYRNTLREADDFVARLLAAIPWRDMVVVLTGDHGEAMLDDGTNRLSHSSSLERPQIGTPMFLYYPGVRPGVDTATTSHLDVFPTIFDVIGAPAITGVQGKSMRDVTTRRSAFVVHNNQNRRPVEAAVVSGRTKILVDLENLRAPRFLGLRTISDEPLSVQEAGVDLDVALAGLRDLLNAHGCGLATQPLPNDSLELQRHRVVATNVRRYCAD